LYRLKWLSLKQKLISRKWNKKMPIWFNNRKALKYLLKHGVVYTLRPRKRKEKDGVTILYTNLYGKPYCTGRRVRVEFIREMDNDLRCYKPYCKQSGFETIKEWVEAANDSRFLYRVELLVKP